MKDTANLEGKEFEYATQVLSDGEETDWLGLARAASEASTDFLDKRYRKQFEKNLANYQSKHPDGSKYYLDSYKTRSRLFRPKTRTAVRKNESAIASALFAASDSVVLEAEDSDDPQKRLDAAYWNEIINYRLDKTIPWFKTVVGAFQEAMIYGVVVSKQYWEYEEIETGKGEAIPDPVDPDFAMTDDTGEVLMRPEIDVIKDRPKIRLVEIENIRFDPASDWTDPINSSPYLLEYIPMYLCDVREKMGRVDEKTGQPEWAFFEDTTILAAGKEQDKTEDSIRAKREKGHDDDRQTVSDFEIVWVHENIVRREGSDWIYYTLGTQRMLTEPEPLENVYLQKQRPYVAGNVVIEAHKAIPSGTVELGENLQAEANDIVNQRLDNVKLVLNQRKYVDRNAEVDLNSLLRSVPGGITLTNDVNAVVPERVQDVTSSAYGEQSRLDTDFDDIAGVFSGASAVNNRQMNETVGGMNMMSQFAIKETEYLIRTFVETWVEPVLRQLVDLEQYYEDDEHIKDIAEKAVQKSEKKRIDKLGGETGGAQDVDQTEELTVPSDQHQNIDVRVNVGFGSLNPEMRIRRVVEGLKVLGEVAPWTMANLDVEEVAKDIFGALGHKNGHKFFSSFERPEPQPEPEVEIKKQELQLKQQELQGKMQIEQAKLELERELGYATIAAKEKLTIIELQAKLGLEQGRAAHGMVKTQQDREIAGANNLTKLAEVERKGEELQFKATTGRQGI